MSDPTVKVRASLRDLRQALDSANLDRAKQIFTTLDSRLTPILDRIDPPPVTLGADEWTKALLDTALEDLRAAKVLAANMDDHAATVAMLYQMVLEKLAKAYLARTDPPAFVANRRSHAAATRFTRFLKLNQDLLPPLGPQRSKALAWAEALTRAHPALAKHGPHLEYPWEQGNRVCTPSHDLSIVNELRDAKSRPAPTLMSFLGHFTQNFDEIWPP